MKKIIIVTAAFALLAGMSGCALKSIQLPGDLRAKPKSISVYIPRATFSTSFQNERGNQGGLLGAVIAVAANKWRQSIAEGAFATLEISSNFRPILAEKLGSNFNFEVLPFESSAAEADPSAYVQMKVKEYGTLPKLKDPAATKANYLAYLNVHEVLFTKDIADNYYSVLQGSLYLLDKSNDKLVFFKQASDTKLLAKGMEVPKKKLAHFTGDATGEWQKVLDGQVKELVEKLFTEEAEKE